MKTPITHPLNVSYLVVGLVFLGIAGSWALRVSGAVDRADNAWLLPAVLVVAGAIGLVAFAAKGLSRGRDERDEFEPAYGVPDGDPDLYAGQDATVETDIGDET